MCSLRHSLRHNKEGRIERNIIEELYWTSEMSWFDSLVLQTPGVLFLLWALKQLLLFCSLRCLSNFNSITVDYTEHVKMKMRDRCAVSTPVSRVGGYKLQVCLVPGLWVVTHISCLLSNSKSGVMTNERYFNQ